jgi:hypothetical protein
MKKIKLALAALALNIACGSVVSYAKDMNMHMMMKDKCMIAKTEDQCKMVMLDKMKDMSMINMMMMKKDGKPMMNGDMMMMKKKGMMMMYDENGMVKMMNKKKKPMMLCTWMDNMCMPTMMKMKK